MMLDDRLLHAFARDFYGYGTYAASYWFVGMQHGGGTSPEEIARRLAAWDDAGRPELVDLRPYHEQIGLTKFFTPPIDLQDSWGRLLRIMMAVEGRDTSLDTLKTYQASELGSSDGETCVLDLLSLPSPSTTTWKYNRYSNLPSLKNETIYREHYARPRMLNIRRRLQSHKPSVVIFHKLDGWSLRHWKEIAGVPFTQRKSEPVKLYIGSNPDTVFAIIGQPTAQGIGYEYLDQVAREIAAARPRP